MLYVVHPDGSNRQPGAWGADRIPRSLAAWRETMREHKGKLVKARVINEIECDYHVIGEDGALVYVLEVRVIPERSPYS